MSWITVPEIESKRKKNKLAFLVKNIKNLNDCERHWLVQTEISNHVPPSYKSRLLSKYKRTNNLNDKYLLFTHRAAGWRSQDRVFRLALLLGKRINRTVVFNSVLFSTYHNRLFSSEPAVGNINVFYDMEKVNLYTKTLNISDMSPEELAEIICDDSKYYHKGNVDLDFIKNLDVKYLCCRSAILDHARYLCREDANFRKEIDYGDHFITPPQSKIQISEEIINSLGDYYAIHVRRGDILYDDSRVKQHKGVDAREVEYYTNLLEHIDLLKKWIPLGAKIYIATDEEDLSIFEGLKCHYDIYFWKDFNINLKPEENNSYYVLGIEEMVMIKARKFISTVPSVIPVYVDYRRGFLEDVDKGIYSLSFDKYFDFTKKQHERFPSTLVSTLENFEKRFIL